MSQHSSKGLPRMAINSYNNPSEYSYNPDEISPYPEHQVSCIVQN